MSSDATLAELASAGVELVRVTYCDLHGIARGKDVPLPEFAPVIDHGLSFCLANLMDDLRSTPVGGPGSARAAGYPDMWARPELATLRRIPWQPGVAQVLCDLERAPRPTPVAWSPRAVLRRAVEACTQLGLDPVVGPELEFFLFEPDPASPRGWRRYADAPSHVYTVGPLGDPRDVLGRLLKASVAFGLDAFAGGHEYGSAQFEINLRHSGALDAADRAFRFRQLVKEMAAIDGLLATFVGRPCNDEGGSGFHLNVSLTDPRGVNAFDDPDGPYGLTPLAAWFLAGVLAHAPALMAILNPTVNAYTRLRPDSLAPMRANWGVDNRTVLVRVPDEGGASRRLEVRIADGSANPYLATAGVLHAGLDGIRRELEPPDPEEGETDALGSDDRLPSDLGAALAALRDDPVLADALGPDLVRSFVAVKEHELGRFRAWVTDWEWDEYTHHL